MQKPYKLFLDDIRDVPMVYPQHTDDDFAIVRSYDTFVNIIESNELPEFISFDNDLERTQMVIY